MHAFKNQEALTTYSKERRRQGAGSEVVKWWFVCVVSVRMTSFWVLLLRCWLQTAVCWTLSAPLCAADHTASKARWEARCCGGEERRGEERRGGGEEGRRRRGGEIRSLSRVANSDHVWPCGGDTVHQPSSGSLSAFKGPVFRILGASDRNI